MSRKILYFFDIISHKCSDDFKSYLLTFGEGLATIANSTKGGQNIVKQTNIEILLRYMLYYNTGSLQISSGAESEHSGQILQFSSSSYMYFLYVYSAEVCQSLIM